MAGPKAFNKRSKQAISEEAKLRERPMRMTVSTDALEDLEMGMRETLWPELDFDSEEDIYGIELEVEAVLSPPEDDEETVEVSERDFNNLVNSLRKYRNKELGSPRSELGLVTQAYIFLATVHGESERSAISRDLAQAVAAGALKRYSKPTSSNLLDMSFRKTLEKVIKTVEEVEDPTPGDLLLKDVAKKYLNRNKVIKDDSLAWIAGQRAALSLYVLSHSIISR